MILAVISEFSEFESGSSEGLELITVGLSIFITTLILSTLLGIKGLKSE